MLLVGCCATDSLPGAPFTTGNMVVYRVGTGTGNLVNTGNPVFLDEYTLKGVLVQSIALPTAVNGSQKRLIASGTATSEGLISRSANGAYLILPGYDASPPHSSALTGTASATVNRVIGRVDGAGSIDTSTALTDAYDANNFRGVTSNDGTQFWMAGNSNTTGGVRYVAVLGETTTTQLSAINTNLRAPLIFGGQLYVSSGSSSTVRLGTVGVGLPTTASQTISTLPGYPVTLSPNAFFLADLDSGVVGVDTLYIADDNGTSGGLLKYSFDGTTWTARGSAGAAADGYRGLTATFSAGTVQLYAVRKGGSTAAGGGELVSLSDASGSTGTLTGTPSLLATAAANTAFRGVAFAPTGFDLSVAVSAPASVFTTAEFDYTITLTNTGLVHVPNVGAQFTLPVGTSFVSTSGAGFTASHSAGVVTFGGGTVNGSSTATLAVKVTAAAAGTISLTPGAAVVDPGSALAETNEANNASTDMAGTVSTDAPDLAITVAAPAAALKGGNWDYTLTVTNNGLVNATGVAAQLTIPAGLSFVSASGPGFTSSEAGGVVSFSDGTINVGSSATLTITVSTPTDGTYTAPIGAAVVDWANSIAEIRESNNTSPVAASTVINTADLAMDLVATGTFQAGEPGAGYTVTVSNAGTGSTSGTVTVSDTLPSGLSATSFAGEGWTIVQGTGGTVIATRSDALAAGDSYPALTLAVDIALNAPSSVDNTATVSGGGAVSGTNDYDSVTSSIASAGPGVIQFAAQPALPASFSSSYYVVNEEAGSITIPLIRTGGRQGPVSVQVFTSNETATAPADYGALSGHVVSFADSEVNGSVTVSLVSGGNGERNEDFGVAMMSPNGGATLGARTQVHVRIIEPDATKPKLTMVQPKNGSTLFDFAPGTLAAMSVTAKDFPGTVRSAEVSVNGGVFQALSLIGESAVGQALDESSITGQILGPGALTGFVLGKNTLQLRVRDYRGNEGTLQSSFTLVRLRALTLNVTPSDTFGTVTLSPNESLSSLQVGKVYTLTAKPKPGKLWSGWSSTQLTLTAVQAASTQLSFTVVEGLTINASFVDDPFVSAVTGQFNGLITATGATTPSNSTNGFINLTVTPTGSFSGTIKMDGLALPITGRFDNGGIARFGSSYSSTLSLNRVGKLAYVLALNLDVNPAGTQRIMGTVGLQDRSGVLPMSVLSADRAAFDGKTPATSATVATYNLALPTQAQTNGLLATQFPQGAGFGTLKVSKQGLATLNVTLADGTLVLATAPLSKTLTVPLFAPLYANQAGALGGLATIDPSAIDTDVSSPAFWWFKPFTGGQHYPHGWPEGVTLPLVGALFSVPAGDSVLPDLASPLGANARLSLTQGKLTSAVQKELVVGISNLVTKVPATDTTFDLKIVTATGGVSGSFTHTDGTRPTFAGIILQKGVNRRAFGHFLSATPRVLDGSGESGDLNLITLYNPRPRLAISELMAKNVSTLADDDGTFSDWVEIYNPGTDSVSLLDWCLTDSASNLTKWRFPDVTLGAKEFLLVWASNKNRTNPAAPLHTNFALSNGGEYLALVRPDGVTIEHQFAPAFPSLGDDESYGINFTGSTLAKAGAAAKYLVPANDNLGGSWTARTFNDAAWLKGKTGIGFGISVPGMKVRQVAASGSFGGVTSIATADALLALPPENAGIASETTVIAPSLNYLGEGGDGHYDGNAVLPNGTAEPYVIKATGNIVIPTNGTYVFGLNSDDGGRIRINSVDVMVDDSNHGAEDHLSSPVSLTAGTHSVEVIMWEQYGGDALEFFAAPGVETSWSSNFKLVGGPGGLVVSTTPLTSGSSSSSAEVATNVQSRMMGINPGCYVRVPFTASGVSRISALTLRMRYNDGFVAYLNGQEIARRNASATPLFNDVATASRTSEQALVVDVIDVSTGLNALVNGTNVLAIHGLNDSAASGTFLVLPELSGTQGLAGDPVFYKVGQTSPTATPGTLNGVPQFVGLVADTKFSMDRGFFSTPFSVGISTATAGATIRYTLDGSTPTPTHGAIYSRPITISKTSILRAMAYRTGFESSDVDTQTYFFLNDIIRQSASGARPAAGWPSGTINGQVANYGMDPQIVNNTNPEIGGVTKVKEALMAIPSVSIVTDLPNLFDASNGIWVNPFGRGFEWERPASLELIGDKNSAEGGFQINCGIRVRGGFSRTGDNPKHGFHVYFRSAYGASKLNYPLFGDEGANSFDQIDFRTAQNYSWSFGGDGNNTFLREETTRELQGAMGQPYARGRYYHLYINGQYWGLYDTEERTEAGFSATYLGGNKDDYDVVKGEQDQGYTTGVTDGNLDAWRDLWDKGRAHYVDPTDTNYFAMQGLAANGVTPTTDPVLLDVDNLIDYMLLTFWTGNLDGCTSAFLGDNHANNWFGSRDRTGTQGFKFFAHDFEHTFFNVDEDRTGPFNTTNNTVFLYSNPMFLHHDLRPNAEYRIRWADHVQQHFFNNGALVSDQVQRRMNVRMTEVDKLIIAESARWGDSKRVQPYTRQDWQGAVDYVINNYVPNRGIRVLTQLRADGLYPSFDAPTLSQFGGDIASGAEVVITGNGGQVYYTLDNSDPRLIGGAVNAAAQTYTSSTSTEILIPLAKTWKYLADGSNQGTAWTASAFDDSTWLSGPAELGYGDGEEATIVPFVDVDAGTAGNQKNATTYFRTTFNVTNAAGITAASLSLKVDDGAAVYLNGVEAMRTSNLPAAAAFNQYATSSVPDESAYTAYAISPASLVEGINTIAVEVHQCAPDSSDISFSLSLSATRTVTPVPLYLTGTGTKHLKVRALLSGEWSALVDAEFKVKNAADLVIASVASGAFASGGTASYTLTVSNTGTAASTGKVTMSATLPPGLTATGLTGAGWTITQGTGSTVSAKRSDALPSGQAFPPLTLAVSIASSASAFVTTTASVSGGGEFTTTNNSATTATPVTGVGASQFQFSAASYLMNEEDASVQVTILRTGLRSGTANVEVHSSNGTAKDSSDYSAVNQTLTFADAEASQTITIGINNDGNAEPNEAFSLALSNVTGGTSLGAITMTTVRILDPDSTAPKVAIITPTSAARVVAEQVIIDGTTSDNKAVARVQVKLNNGVFADAVMTTGTRYTAALTAPTGANSVTVRAYDFRGNVSNEVAHSFSHVPLRPLTLTIAPTDAATVTISPNAPLTKLQLGTVYTLKAAPKLGYVWSNWTGPSINTEAESLSFTMTDGLAITANFAINPYLTGFIGSYDGLVNAAVGVPPRHSNHGQLHLQMTGTGSFTGTLKMDGLSLPLSGVFNSAGAARFGVNRTTTLKLLRLNRPSLLLAMSIHLITRQVTGTLNEDDRMTSQSFSTLVASPSNGALPATSPYLINRGRYAVSIPARSQTNGLTSADFPQVASTGVITVARGGTLTLVGTLSDGTKVTVTAPLSTSLTAPLYAPLYAKPGGSLNALVVLDDSAPSSDLKSEDLIWFRPVTHTGAYPLGWEQGLVLELTGVHAP